AHGRGVAAGDVADSRGLWRVATDRAELVARRARTPERVVSVVCAGGPHRGEPGRTRGAAAPAVTVTAAVHRGRARQDGGGRHRARARHHRAHGRLWSAVRRGGGVAG